MNKYKEFLSNAVEAAEMGDGYLIIEIHNRSADLYWAEESRSPYFNGTSDNYLSIPCSLDEYESFEYMIADKYRRPNDPRFRFNYKGKLRKAIEEVADDWCCCHLCTYLDDICYEEMLNGVAVLEEMFGGAKE